MPCSELCFLQIADGHLSRRLRRCSSQQQDGSDLDDKYRHNGHKASKDKALQIQFHQFPCAL
jgi:hypothetical protein